ncbi:hypothetical protein C0Q70_19315 [Pomacea canaliculata]|uniref:Uncharacterized protein n=1 Tax=Pomacea canaliculata TaxID=400727 RepID=A0A2T7NJ20_POMCA|nr:hypothetical protein C0Q70_19315 [Pomacea canaliculata]
MLPNDKRIECTSWKKTLHQKIISSLNNVTSEKQLQLTCIQKIYFHHLNKDDRGEYKRSALLSPRPQTESSAAVATTPQGASGKY